MSLYFFHPLWFLSPVLPYVLSHQPLRIYTIGSSPAFFCLYYPWLWAFPSLPCVSVSWITPLGCGLHLHHHSSFCSLFSFFLFLVLIKLFSFKLLIPSLLTVSCSWVLPLPATPWQKKTHNHTHSSHFWQRCTSNFWRLPRSSRVWTYLSPQRKLRCDATRNNGTQMELDVYHFQRDKSEIQLERQQLRLKMREYQLRSTGSLRQWKKQKEILYIKILQTVNNETLIFRNTVHRCAVISDK